MSKKNNSILFIYGNIKFTIRDQFGYWYLDFYLPTGDRQRGTTKLKATLDNLKIIKREIIPDIYVGLGEEALPQDEEDRIYTLYDFANIFFDLQKTKIREHTLYRNMLHYNNHIEPYFGKKEIQKITPLELERWQNQLLQKYKHLTVQKYRSILFSIFDKAVQNDIISKNPLEKITAPKNIRGLKVDEISPFNENEIAKILENADDGYMKNFITLMVSTGLRPGEIIALKWSDINFEKQTINIERTRVRAKKGEAFTDGLPKTESSIRTIDMLSKALEALKEQFEITKEKEYIFINSSGYPFYSHDIIGVNFNKILKKANIQARPLYNLRHTFASQLISKGVDIVWVSKMLGHKDVSITLKVYTKYIQEDDEARLRKIAEIDKIIVKV